MNPKLILSGSVAKKISTLVTLSLTALSQSILIFFCFLIFFSFNTKGQTIRYQQNIRGGFGLAGNALLNDPSKCGCQLSGVPVNTAGGTSMSSSSDLILPAGASIVRAFLYVEGYSLSSKKITSVKFGIPGGAYQTLTSSSPGFIANPSATHVQFIMDVTSLVPSNGFVSAVVNGGDPSGNGKYSVADVTPFDASNRGYGWTLIAIYTHPSSRYRNVTVVDNDVVFGDCGGIGVGTSPICSITFNVNGISVPSSGTVPAVIATTATYGDDGLPDYAQFGKAGGALTNLSSPIWGGNTDITNSSIGFCANNNVSIDANAAGSPIPINGSYVARNPNTFNDPNSGSGTAGGNWSSYFYDMQILDATGILTPSATPINVTFKQGSSATKNDIVGGGAYIVSVDIIASLLTKSLSPTSITPGGIATYTWTIDNTLGGALNLTSIGFTDNLPNGIIVANPNGIILTGGSGGTVTANPGSTSVKLSGFTLNAGQIATLKVNVTNVPGQTNPDCSTNPLAFTNGFTNISGQSANITNGVTNQCLVVDAAILPIGLLYFDAKKEGQNIFVNWALPDGNGDPKFEVERSIDGNVFSKIGETASSRNNSTTNHYYAFTDEQPFNGVNYYRLKQINSNGKSNHSEIISTQFFQESSFQIKNVFPSPAKDNIIVEFVLPQKDQHASFSIYNLIGAKMFEKEIETPEAGLNQQSIDISMLPSGIYYLHIKANEQELTSKIVK